MTLFTHDNVRWALILFATAISPYVLRAFGNMALSALLKLCCGMTRADLRNSIIGNGHRELSIVNIRKGKLTWTEAREIQGLNQCAAMFVSGIRLILWHWLQPVSYALVLYAYWNEIDHIQQILGLIVGVRECIYFLFSILCVVYNPCYFMVDLRATVHYGSYWYVVQYVLSPVKSMCSVLIRTHLYRKRRRMRRVAAFWRGDDIGSHYANGRGGDAPLSMDNRRDGRDQSNQSNHHSTNHTKTLSFAESHNNNNIDGAVEYTRSKSCNQIVRRQAWEAPRMNVHDHDDYELWERAAEQAHRWSDQGGLKGHDMIMLMLIVMDMSGVIALVHAGDVGKVYAPLVIGYAITAVDGVFEIIYFVGLFFTKIVQCWRDAYVE